MSKLNVGASEFVPGRPFRYAPQQAPPPPTLQPVEREEQDEAPPPAPTITLNIGGSKPPPPPPADVSDPEKDLQRVEQPPAPPSAAATAAAVAKPSAPASTATPSAPSKTFSTEKAKTDAAAIQQHVHTIADQETLKDLFGDSKVVQDSICAVTNNFHSKATSQYRFHRSCRCREKHDGR